MSDESNSGRHPWMRVIQSAEPHFNEINEANGKLVAFKREAMFAHQAFENPAATYLRSCDPNSLFNALVNVASVGLTLSPAERLAYLVPRAEGKGKDRRVLCCLDISYRGLKKIAEDNGSILTAVAEIVREGDEFEWIDKLTRPVHKFDPFASERDRGPVRGVYCMAVLPSGLTQVEALSMEDLRQIRDCSKAESGPWVDWWGEMAKKSAVRRASKMWPHNRRLAEAFNILDAHQGLVDPTIALPATVEQPSAAEPDPSAGARNPAPPTPAEGSSGEPTKAQDPNADKPMQAGQLRILKAKCKSAGIDEGALHTKFGAADSLKFGDFDRIQKWIQGGGKD